MSKAEKFIKDYTRNGSNEILSPYPQIINDVRRIGGEPAKEFSPWLTPDQARRAVEIAREETFEKMKFYIESMVSDITFSDINGNDNYSLNKFIEDLKQATKDE